MPTVSLASDHRGFKLKEALKHAFPDFVDLGPHTFDPEHDYNDAALAVAKRIQSEPDTFGVLICGSAIGISIQANRFKKVRAAVALTPKAVQTTREHNDANVLCLSADSLSVHKAKKLIKVFLATPFSGEERHVRRINRLDQEAN